VSRFAVAATPRLTLRSLRLAALGLVVGVIAAVDLYLAVRSLSLILNGAVAVDWVQYLDAGRRVAVHGDLYAITDTYAYRYSPFLAYLFIPLGFVGTVGWRVLHVVAAMALPTWPMRLLTLVSWPFWYDVQTGNLLVFIVLAGAWALRGNRLATGAFLLLTILVPRPLMIPVAVWLLWRGSEWRLPFVGLLLAHTGMVVALGWLEPWVGTLLNATTDAGLPSNIGPSRFIGGLWVVIGVPFAAWLTWKGRLGLASAAASPYWLPYYLLMPVLELAPKREGRRAWPR
jgi:hypothetical protein